MKRQLFYCLALLFLMNSCMEEPNIYLLLPDEDAAAIPYKLGDQMQMVNQDGDTIHFIVTYDELETCGSEYDYIFVDDTKFDPPEPGPWCYGRRVQLRSYADGIRIAFLVMPNKAFEFFLDSQIHLSIYCQLNGETQDFTVGETTYENVYFRQESNPNTANPNANYQWYYSEEVGLIAVKYKDQSLTLLP